MAFFGEIERAAFEGEQAAIEGALPFHVGGEVESAIEDLAGFADGGDAGIAILAVDGDERPMRMMPPQMGILNNSFFTIAEVRRGIRAMVMGGSRLEMWFDMKM